MNGRGSPERAKAGERRVTFGEQVRGWLPVRRPTVLRTPSERRTARLLARRYRPEAPPAATRCGSGLADVLVLKLDSRQRGAPGEGQVVLKHAQSGPAAAALRREWEVLTLLRGQEQLGEWRRLLPVPLERRLDGPLPMIVESCLPGRDAATVLIAHPEAADRVASLALEALAGLNRATAGAGPGAQRVEGWVADPLATVRGQVPWCRTGAGEAGLTAVGGRLRDALARRPGAVGWTHGDYHPGNLLLDERLSRVTGVVDWGEARESDPVAVDAYTWVITLRCLLTGAGLGAVVARIVREGALDPADLDLLARAGLADRADDAAPDFALLAWLRHVAANVAKSPRYGRSRIWFRRAVSPVLAEAVRWQAP
jgi:hypothetical protein